MLKSPITFKASSGLSLTSAFKSVAGLFGASPAEPRTDAPQITIHKPVQKPARVSTERKYSCDLNHFHIPATPITPETLAETPPHIEGKDGKALIWAYIGKDDPTRGDSRGANGLAQEVARLMDGKAIYVDKAMLDRHFQYADSLHDALVGLIARHGAPDIVIGTHSRDVLNVRGCKPTMVIKNINESIDAASRERTNLVPHDLTPQILKTAGSEFREKHPNLKGKLYTVMVSTYYSKGPMEKLAHILAQEEESTVYFCPNRRVSEERYKELVSTLSMHLLHLGIDNRAHIIAPTFDEMSRSYNPYRGLIAESDHMIQCGDSHSMVAESVCTGRPLYLMEDFQYYPKLADLGYLRDFASAPCKPFPATRLPPISITTEVAGRIVEEFDRLARLRTIGTRTEDEARKQRLEQLAATHNSSGNDNPPRAQKFG